MASTPTTDPDRFKMIKNRLAEYRTSHPQVFKDKGDEFAQWIAGIVVEEFDFLATEHKALCESGLEHDAKKANAAYDRLDEISKESKSIIEQHGFIKRVDSAMFRDMTWLIKDIERLDRLQPAERDLDPALLSE